MKYIRTKYRIYESNKVSFDEKYVYKYEVRPIWQINQEQQEIIAQADTIEELCDEFVVSYEDNQHIVYQDLEWAKDKANRGTFKYVIYGAIWTDEGLIYVAKMNDKGELELL